jgi:hypothetical protein
MKEQNSIPTSKVARATQFVKTGVKIGGNYLKHNVKKIIDPTTLKKSYIKIMQKIFMNL